MEDRAVGHNFERDHQKTIPAKCGSVVSEENILR
jgi:hypothetical protein